ncbi:hypothetical protein FOL47_007100 [Perkinsus chesapeaki]|uniref:Uncharacterized protein n=1 Tax=Perkinsus chesapeaki TaxID=330153 RepID=A0A7J6LMR2_PERCH|nr:hypothetical protein FOL47_007100 [Perkinsus chesapeaki]
MSSYRINGATEAVPAIPDPVAQTTTLVDYPGRKERFLPGASLLRCRICPSDPQVLVIVGVIASTEPPTIVMWFVPIGDLNKATHEVAIPLTCPTVTSLDLSPDCRSVMVSVASRERSGDCSILMSSGGSLPVPTSVHSSVGTPGSSSCSGSSVASRLTPQSTESRPCLQTDVVVWVELVSGLPEPPTALAWIEYSPVSMTSGQPLQEEPVTYICMGFLTGEVALVDAEGAEGGSLESQFNCRTPVTDIEVIPCVSGPPILLVHLSASPCFFLLMTAVDSHTGVLRLEAQVLPLPCPDPRSVRFFSDQDTWYISSLSNCGRYVYMSVLPEGDSTLAVTPVARIPTAGQIPITDHCLVTSSEGSSSGAQRRSILVACVGSTVLLMTASAAGCDNIVLAVVPCSPGPTAVRLLAPTATDTLPLSCLCFATVSPATLYRLEFQDRSRIQAAVEACVARAAVDCLPRGSQRKQSRQFFDTGFPLICQSLSELVDLDDVCLAAGLRVMDTPDHNQYEKLCCCLFIWQQRYSTKPVPFAVVRALLLHVGAAAKATSACGASDDVTPEGLGNYRLELPGVDPIIPFEYFVGLVSDDGKSLAKPGIFHDHWGPGLDLGSGGMLAHPARRLWILELSLGMVLGERVSSEFVGHWLDEIDSRAVVFSSSRNGFQELVEIALKQFRPTWPTLAKAASSLSYPPGGLRETVARFVGLPDSCHYGVAVLLAVLTESCAPSGWEAARHDTGHVVQRLKDAVAKCWVAPGSAWSIHTDCLIAVMRLARRVWQLLAETRKAHLEAMEIKPVMRGVPSSPEELLYKATLMTMEERAMAHASASPTQCEAAWSSSDHGLYRISNHAKWLMADGETGEDFSRLGVDETLDVMARIAFILRRDERLWEDLPWSQKFRLRLIRKVMGDRKGRGA